MLNFCRRHSNLLEDAVDLRGLRRVDPLPGEFDALAYAHTAIVDHATHFAGKAAVRMLETQSCPLCFCNAAITKQGGVDVGNGKRTMNVDGWVDNAADEAAEADIQHQDEGGKRPLIVTA